MEMVWYYSQEFRTAVNMGKSVVRFYLQLNNDIGVHGFANNVLSLLCLRFSLFQY